MGYLYETTGVPRSHEAGILKKRSVFGMVHVLKIIIFLENALL